MGYDTSILENQTRNSYFIELSLRRDKLIIIPAGLLYLTSETLQKYVWHFNDVV